MILPRGGLRCFHTAAAVEGNLSFLYPPVYTTLLFCFFSFLFWRFTSVNPNSCSELCFVFFFSFLFFFFFNFCSQEDKDKAAALVLPRVCLWFFGSKRKKKEKKKQNKRKSATWVWVTPNRLLLHSLQSDFASLIWCLSNQQSHLSKISVKAHFTPRLKQAASAPLPRTVLLSFVPRHAVDGLLPQHYYRQP